MQVHSKLLYLVWKAVFISSPVKVCRGEGELTGRKVQRDLTVGFKEWVSEKRESKINCRSEKELNTIKKKHGKRNKKNCNWKRFYKKTKQNRENLSGC